MKRYGNLYPEITCFENILLATKKARQGYRIYPNHMRARKTVVKRYRRKLKRLSTQYKKGLIDLDRVNASVQSWIGHVRHGDSYRLRENLFSQTVFSRSN